MKVSYKQAGFSQLHGAECSEAALARLGEAAALFHSEHCSSLVKNPRGHTQHPVPGLPTEGFWFCWLGIAPSWEPSLSAKRLDQSLPLETRTNPSALRGISLRDRSREVVCPGSLGLKLWWRSACHPIISLPPVTPVSPSALCLSPPPFALRTEI